MEQRAQQPKRGIAAIRLLAAALAGAIGAFGFPAATHRATTAQPTTATAAAPAEIQPE
jgi:hypothetical protein